MKTFISTTPIKRVMLRLSHYATLAALVLILALTGLTVSAAAPLAAQIASAPSPAAVGGLTDPQELESFLEPLMAELMESKQIPGGAIAVVKDGQLFFAKGYGYADLEREIPATADTTIFRAGSVAKLFTWTAVMQLVEQGKLDLNVDVNSYLKGFQVPATFPEPITLAHLMAHTGGFEDQEVDGKLLVPEAAYQPLSDFLAANIPARIFPPGQYIAYSNYGAALAGEIVAEVSGEPFEQYIATHILQPLEMGHSSFLQPLPSELADDAAVNYAADEAGVPHAGLPGYFQVRPAVSLSASATDMAHFMIAHLQDGRYGEGEILLPATAQEMRKPSYVFHPQLSGVTKGFAEYERNNLQLVYHMGDTFSSQAMLALLPDQNVGIYVAFNSFGRVSTRLTLLNAILDHYYPLPQAPAQQFTGATQDIARFAGSYLTTRRSTTSVEKLGDPMLQLTVMANSDGTLSVDGFRDSAGVPKQWGAISPLVFQEVGGQSRIAFSEDASGRITALYNSDQPVVAFQKLAWYAAPMTRLIGVGLALLVLLVTAVVWPVGALVWLLRKKPSGPTRMEPRARYLAGAVILLDLVVVGLIVPVLTGDPTALLFALPPSIVLAGKLALVSAVGTLGVLLLAAGSWSLRTGSLVGRLHYSLVAMSALYFVWYLSDVNVLAFSF